MDPLLIAQVLRRRRCWRARDSRSRARLLKFQTARADELRALAASASPFYRRHLKGYERAPLSELPPVTKQELMAHLDEVVTVPGLREKPAHGVA